MRDLIIIGAGPAGLTAGLYAGRFRLDTLIFEKMAVGGQIVTSAMIDNFPGFPGGIPTEELTERLSKQVDDLGVPVEMEEVSQIVPDFNSARGKYKVKAGDKVYESKSIIIATGAYPKKLGIDGEERLSGRGVSYCATCDAPLFKNKKIIVVGGGDKAVEETIFLTNYASSVTLIHRRQELRASMILYDKAKINPKIKFIFDTVIEEIKGENKVEAVKIKNVKSGEIADVTCDGIFVFVGIIPNTEIVKNLLNINALGFIIANHKLETSLPGIFACGDCLEKSLYQVITASSDGAIAADSAHKYILSLKA